MNKMVQYMVELLFRDVEDSAEVMALRDEVMANCQAHYDDLIRRGVSQEEAIAAVTESLQGMEDVVSQYPRRAQKTAEEPVTAEEPAEACAVDEEAFDKSAVRDELHHVQLEMKGWSVTLQPSEDGRVNVRCEGEGANCIETRIEEDRLIIREKMQQPENGNVMDELKQLKWESFDQMLESVKTVTRVAVRSLTNVFSVGEGTVVIELPQGLQSVTHHAISGDLTVNGVAVNSLEAGTTSGDIDLTTGSYLRQAKIRTTSGDIDLNAHAGDVELNTISGDVDINGSARRLTVVSVSGDIDLSCQGEHPELVQINSTSGDIDCRMEHTGVDELNARTVSGDVTVILPRDEYSVQVNMRSASGDCSSAVPSAGENAACHITAQTMSGDIRIDRA